MKLYIVRHGQTKWNTENRMQGWENSDLTEDGIAQAKLLGEALSDVNFKKVYTSPLARAMETAENLIGDRDIEVKVNESFKEMSFGLWEGKTADFIKSKYEDQYKDFWNYADKFTPVKGGETFEEVSKRVKSGIDELRKSNYKDGDNILLVSHGIIIQMLILHSKGLSLKHLWDRQVVNSSSLTIIEINKSGEMNILTEDNIDHLKQ